MDHCARRPGGDGSVEVVTVPAVVAAQAFTPAVLAFTTLFIVSISVRTIAGIARGELRPLTL